MGCLNSQSSIHEIRSLILQWPTTHVPFCIVWHERRVAVLTYLRLLFMLSYIYKLNIIKWLYVIRSSMFLYLVWWKDNFRWFFLLMLLLQPLSGCSATVHILSPFIMFQNFQLPFLDSFKDAFPHLLCTEFNFLEPFVVKSLYTSTSGEFLGLFLYSEE